MSDRKASKSKQDEVYLDALAKAQLQSFKFLEKLQSPKKSPKKKGFNFKGGQYRQQLENKCKEELKQAKRTDSPVKRSLSSLIKWSIIVLINQITSATMPCLIKWSTSLLLSRWVVFFCRFTSPDSGSITAPKSF